MRSEESLRHEMERIQKRLAREKQSETEREAATKAARLAKCKSRLNFLKSQTPECLNSSIVSAENKQLLLQGQIAKLQEWIRVYNDLILTRDEQIATVTSEIDRLEGRAPEAKPTVESVQEQWAYLQGLLK